MAKYVPAAPGLRSPMLWGDPAHIVELFGARSLRAECRTFKFRYRSAAHFVEVFRAFYGPTHKAFAALDTEAQAALTAELTALLERRNVAGPGSLVVPAEYLEIVVTR